MIWSDSGLITVLEEGHQRDVRLDAFSLLLRFSDARVDEEDRSRAITFSHWPVGSQERL